MIDQVGDMLLYGKIRFSMPQLRSMIHGLVETAQVALHWDLLLLEVDKASSRVVVEEEGGSRAILPAINWQNMVDNPAEMKVG